MEYSIVTQYYSRGKHPILCTIIDILKTYDSKNELVKTRYVASHMFMGQVVIDSEVVNATVALGLLKGEN